MVTGLSTYLEVVPGTEIITESYEEPNSPLTVISPRLMVYSPIDHKNLVEILAWAAKRLRRGVYENLEYTYRTKDGEFEGYIHNCWFFVQEYLNEEVSPQEAGEE